MNRAFNRPSYQLSPSNREGGYKKPLGEGRIPEYGVELCCVVLCRGGNTDVELSPVLIDSM